MPVHCLKGQFPGGAGSHAGGRACCVQAFHCLPFPRLGPDYPVRTSHYTHPTAGAGDLAALVGNHPVRSPVHGTGDAGVNARGVLAVPAVAL